MTEREYLAALSTFTLFGPRRIDLMLSFFKSAEKVWKADRKNLLQLGLSEKLVEQFIKHRDSFNIRKYFNELKRLNINFVTINDEGYPVNLKEIDTAPPVLYIKGGFRQEDINAVAIIGSRKATSYGREVADKVSRELASLGVVVISGLAKGVDSVAHKAALAVGGRTMAVLACGLDRVYPAENANLARAIVAKGGVLISEYPLGYPALRVNFVNRNRIISGLSRAVVVIEGERKSGTLLTASHAANQGRQVFAVPGQITSPMSQAPHFLIKNGATILTSTQDILEELDMQFKLDREEVEKVLPSTKEEEEILNILANDELHLDEIIRISSLDAAEVSARLTMMELKGVVKNLGGGVYRKT